MEIILKGKPIVKGNVCGYALVSKLPFSFFLGLNTDNGEIIEEGHPHQGEVITGKVLVYPFGKGSSGDCLRLWRAANNGVAPLAIINQELDFIHVQGAIITGIPMVCLSEMDPTSIIQDGDKIIIDEDYVKIIRGEH